MKKSLLCLLLIEFGIIVTSSCKIANPDTTPPIAAFHFIHASPDAPNLDVYIGGEAITEDFAYGRDSGYFTRLPGIDEFKMAATGTLNFLIDSYISFNAGSKYSVFVIDSLNKIRLANVEDLLRVPGGDSSELRFLNFCAGSFINAKFYNTTDSIKYSLRRFNDQEGDTTKSNFKPVKAGTYNLQITPSDTTAPLINFTGITLTTGKSYTLYLRGFNNGTGAEAMDTGIIRHN